MSNDSDFSRMVNNIRRKINQKSIFVPLTGLVVFIWLLVWLFFSISYQRYIKVGTMPELIKYSIYITDNTKYAYLPVLYTNDDLNIEKRETGRGYDISIPCTWIWENGDWVFCKNMTFENVGYTVRDPKSGKLIYSSIKGMSIEY